MVYIHTVFFICPSVSAKNRPGLLLRKPGRFDCVICAFPSAHAITCGENGGSANCPAIWPGTSFLSIRFS